MVRIYDRKVKYLFVDCNDAVSKIKLAFSGDMVDLPEKAFESATLNVADFGSFDDDQFEDSTNIDQWASLALKQSNRQISNDIDVKTPKGVRSLMDDGAKENTNFRQTNRKWLAFDDELDEPEVLRNAPTESKEEDVLDQSMDDPETLRRGTSCYVHPFSYRAPKHNSPTQASRWIKIIAFPWKHKRMMTIQWLRMRTMMMFLPSIWTIVWTIWEDSRLEVTCSSLLHLWMDFRRRRRRRKKKKSKRRHL